MFYPTTPGKTININQKKRALYSKHFLVQGGIKVQYTVVDPAPNPNNPDPYPNP